MVKERYGNSRAETKGTVRPEKLEFDEALQEAFIQFVLGRFLMKEVEGFLTRKIYRNAS